MILLIVPLLAMFGWEAITSVVAWDSHRTNPVGQEEVVCHGHDDGSPEQNLFRKPVILFRSAPSHEPGDVQLPPEDGETGAEDFGCGRGLVATGSNAECRAPPICS